MEFIIFLGFIFLFFWLKEVNARYKRRKFGEQVRTNYNEVLELLVTAKQEIQPIMRKLFLTSPCIRCGEGRFRFVKANESLSGIQVECLGCSKKTWIKSVQPAPDGLKNNLKSYNEVLQILFNASYNLLISNVTTQKNGFSGMEEERNSRDIILFSTNAGNNPNSRHSIPSRVKQAVWQRDGGKCVNCGSNENLEYDHIIPVSKGGANTARNIQLLCERCNRRKLDKIV